MDILSAESEAGPKTRRAGSREAIVAAAERLFLERGFGSVSMDELAEAAGAARRPTPGKARTACAIDERSAACWLWAA